MSLYNLLHGTNKLAPLLLKVLKLDTSHVGRFRDIYLNKDGTKIILLTRNGGGNREDYQDVFEAMERHPNYLTDYDDDFDCTYAYIEFSVPERFKESIAKLSTGKKPQTLKEKFDNTIAEMKKMTPEQMKQDERFKSMNEILKKIADPENKQKIFKI